MSVATPADVHRQRRRRLLTLWVPLLGALSALLVWQLVAELRVSSRIDGASSELDATAEGISPLHPDTLRIAVAPVISPRASLPQYHALVEYLGRAVGRRGVAVFRDTYAEVEALLRTRQVDVAFVCTHSFARGERDYGLQLLAVPVIGGEAEYYSLLVVAADQPIETLQDLRGKRIASADILSNTGWVYLADRIRASGHAPDGYFSKVTFTGGHDRAIRAVAQGMADGAAVDSLVYEHMLREEPELGGSVRVIHRSPPFGMPPVVAPGELDPALRASVASAFERMHEDPAGQEALEPLKIDRFIPPDSASYEDVRALMASHERGRR